MQTGFFDWHDRLGNLNKNDDPLLQLDKLINWEQFCPTLEPVRNKKRKSNAGIKSYDVILMFKILYGLPLMRFLKLSLGDRVPDVKIVWLFRHQLIQAKLIDKLFVKFDTFLKNSDYSARKGQIIDVSIISAPKQRNRRDVYADSAYRFTESVQRHKAGI